MRIGIIYKETEEAKNLSKIVFEYLKEKRIDTFYVDNEKDLSNSIILSFGGDGTLLKAFQYAYKFDSPILGINLGGLGFLTDVEKEDVFVAIEKLISNKFKIETRKVLECEIIREGKSLGKYFAFNDFVISKDTLSQIITIEIFIDGISVFKMKGDGVIVSTPNGSTAYSLSAGGPILSPKCEAYLLTTLCSHKLTARPVVLSKEEKLSIKINEEESKIFFIEDGIKREDLIKNDHLLFRLSDRDAKLVRLKEKNFYQIVNSKFNWGS
ncbi:MAG: NAD(+)/NADH kinase [Caldisericia bacterium]|nr:NAD(+)/NADH kinase [Caldisericia bacterium]